MKRFAIASTLALLTACSGAYQSYTSSALTRSQVANVESVVSSTLRDPGSAQFRNIRLVTANRKDGGAEQWVCGEVNGKNGFGGYVGFQPFVGDLTASGFKMKFTESFNSGLPALLCQNA